MVDLRSGILDVIYKNGLILYFAGTYMLYLQHLDKLRNRYSLCCLAGRSEWSFLTCQKTNADLPV